MERALYGLPISGFSFKTFLSKNLKELGYTPSKVDTNVYMQAAVKSDGKKYCENVMGYVNVICACGESPQSQMDAIAKRFKLKDGSVEEPKLYLGANIEKFEIPEDLEKFQCALSSTKYTGKALEEVKRKLASEGAKLPTKVTTPLSNKYSPECDASRELSSEEQNHYQGMIGILR